ncbi:g3023 [Coccomyxa viridis]|uniref:Cytochrome c-553 n=1 Tax=Coccomyxa viridis TaxID=1274662 RepID=A0ABP1FPS9_9CHLO
MAASLIAAPISSASFLASRPAVRRSRAAHVKVTAQAQDAKRNPAAAMIVGGLAWAAVTLSASAADLSAGEDVFTGNCAACHSGGGNVIEAGKTLQKDAISQYLDGGLSEAAIIKQVQNGKNAMPAWSGRLSEDEINDVAAYVYDQASNDKW